MNASRERLLEDIADYICRYREAQRAPALMLHAVLATFAEASSSDYGRALILANRRAEGRA